MRIVATAPPRNVTRPEEYLVDNMTREGTEGKTLQLERAIKADSSKEEVSSFSKHQVSSSTELHKGNHKEP